MTSFHANAPVAIIDIGSNSVRLVVYSGNKRIPSVIFNEKVMAGLGAEVAARGRLSDEAQDRALRALARFRRLIDDMGTVAATTVATAAVRDAENGADFIGKIRSLGLAPRILSEDEEGRMAGLGVISAIPDADGIVGDLGGGSLELVDVRAGQVGRRVSLPFGILRLKPLFGSDRKAFRRHVADAVAEAGLEGAARGRDFYMVGGSWRALARVDLALTRHPLPITHQHVMHPGRPTSLHQALPGFDPKAEAIPSLSSSRVPALPGANRLLESVTASLEPNRLVASSFGIREGLLYDMLDLESRKLDPLIEAAREAGAGLGRFEQHGALLDRWLAPLFDDPPAEARLRLAACLLADIAWATHPDFRAERGVDMALHGHWVAIDAPGRVMIATALFANFGGGSDFPYPRLVALCTPAQRKRAVAWGYAIRLGQRLGGGVAAGLEQSRLVRDGGTLRLELDEGAEALGGEAVERRLRRLASEVGLESEISRSRRPLPGSTRRGGH